MKKTYLAGPMTGHANHNYPAFIAATADLRARGWDILSPHEYEAQGITGDPDAASYYARVLASKDGLELVGKPYNAILARDVQCIADDCDGIIFLQGWERSKGARLEAFVALNWGYTKFWHYNGPGFEPSVATQKFVMSCVYQYTSLAHGMNG